MKKILIYLSPYFINKNGHDLPYQKAVHKAFNQQNIDVYTYFAKDNPINLPKKYWIKYFSSPTNRLTKILMRLLEYKKLWQYKKFYKNHLIYFIESFSLIDLIAITTTSYLFANKNRELWLLFRDGVSSKYLKRFIQTLFLKLVEIKFKNNLILLSDSILVGQSLNNYINKKIHTLPIPHTHEITVNNDSKKNRKSILLWIPGKFRNEKGVNEIIQMLLSENNNDYTFELFCSHNPSLDKIKTNVKVTVIKRLDENEYYQMFTKTDIILLPYNPKDYIFRTSGVFVEAIVNGKMTLVQEGSWLAYELKRFSLEELILNWNDPLLLTNISKIFKNEKTQNKIKKMRKAYKSYHSQNHFNQQILHILNY